METSSKRIASASDAHPGKRRRYNDSATGQRNALPGLDDSDDEIEDELTKEAVMYLRGVRSEAASIPSLLVAAKPGAILPTTDDAEESYTKLKRPELKKSHDEEAYDEDYNEYEGHQDDGQQEDDTTQETSGGYYRDGVYAVAPIIGPHRPSAAHLAELDPSDPDMNGQPILQEADDAFHSSLLRRFQLHKANFGTTMATQTTAFGLKIWRTRLVSNPPTKEQIAHMDYSTLWRCLGLASRLLQRRGRFKASQMKILGAWLWCLFAKIEDIVTLSSEEVAVVREVGKAAIEVIRRRVMNEEDAEDGDEDDGEEADSEMDGDLQEETLNDYREEEEPVDNNTLDNSEYSRPKLERRNTSSDEEDEDDEVALRAARARLLKDLHTPASAITESTPAFGTADNTFSNKQDTSERETEHDLQETEEQMDAVLDMVLTIVGEEFGQRDLLVARDVLW